MVSNSSNPPEEFYRDPTGMALPGLSPFPPMSAQEELDKKVRKPYTITKSRQSWTEPEHDKFLEALQLFDRDWKKIEAFIGSKTVIQIRSHAQKYFLKVQKGGGNEHLPPPRPKRKAAHPYPHKASKSALAIPQIMGTLLSRINVSLAEPENAFKPDAPSMLISPTSNVAAASSWTDNSSQASAVPNTSRGEGHASSTVSTPRVQPVGWIPYPSNKTHAIRVLPDFAQVYGFIGSVFDPNITDHIQNLKQMDPIDVETVLLLMRNLSINLTSPDFADHRKLLSTYEIDPRGPNYDMEDLLHYFILVPLDVSTP